MSGPPLAREPAGRGSALPYVVAGIALGLTLAGTLLGPYGYFIDELYYIACAKRLAWGYVDHPPLSILLLAAVRSALGESLLALRLLPALATAVTALVGGLLARRLGGGPFAQALATLATATAPVFLVLGTFYSMNAFELLLWPVVGFILVSILGLDWPRGWLLVGALVGLGLENKHTTLLCRCGDCRGARRHTGPAPSRDPMALARRTRGAPDPRFRTSSGSMPTAGPRWSSTGTRISSRTSPRPR